MRINLLIILLILSASMAFCRDLGNEISSDEYPEYDEVMPSRDYYNDKVISGSVKKDVKINLGNCIKLALGNNPEINSAFQEILASDSRIKQVWSAYFPTFGWQTSYSHIKQLQLSDALSRNLQYDYYLLGQITIQQLIYDFGVTQNQATIKRIDYEIAKKDFISVVNDIIYRTKEAYFNYLLSIENLEVARDSLGKYQDFYNQAKAFYQMGMNPKVDVTIALTNLSDAKLNLITAETKVQQSVAELNHIMGVPYIQKYSSVEKLEFKPIDIEFEEAVAIASNSRAELDVAKMRVESAHQKVKLAKKGYLPQLAFEYQYQRGGKHWTSNDGFLIGGFLIFNQMNGILVRNQIKEAIYNYDKALADAKRSQNLVYYEIQSAYLKLLETKNRIPLSKLKVRQAQENYDLSHGRYKVGEATPIELKDAQITLNDAKLGYYSSVYEYNKAKAYLEKSIGRNLTQAKDYVSLKK